jgi:NTE family protein
MAEFVAQEVQAEEKTMAVLRRLTALDDSWLRAFRSEVEWLSVPAGWTLFRECEVADALYVVISGCLRVTVRDDNGGDIPVARIQSGETVGEMALFAGGLRSATVTAIRDTELLRLGKSSCERLFQQHPRSMLPLLSLLAQRLSNTTHHVRPRTAIRTLALVPTGSGADHRRLAVALGNELARNGRRVRLLYSDAAMHTTTWFNLVESVSDQVLYCAEPTDSTWTKLCLRQADRVLLVAPSNAALQLPAWLAADGPYPSVDLAVMHEGSGAAHQAAEHWRNLLPIDLLCQVRRDNPGDVARLSRLLTGRAVGLVLGGGGARGFAHLGVIRALGEAGIPMDMIGGCSMGAIVGAGVALEWQEEEVKERLQRAFVDSNPINDYTLPFLALARGQKMARRLEEHFSDIRIEDLWRPYFCVSTNLTLGSLAIHRSGPLAQALQASVSVPGLLPPVPIDGEAHVDGGIINCLPVDVMSSMRRGPVIAVDVASDPGVKPFRLPDEEASAWRLLRGCRKMPPIVDLLVRAGTVGGDALGRLSRSQADILFRPPLDSVDLLDWRACAFAIEVGYRHAIEKLDQLVKSGLSLSW